MELVALPRRGGKTTLLLDMAKKHVTTTDGQVFFVCPIRSGAKILEQATYPQLSPPQRKRLVFSSVALAEKHIKDWLCATNVLILFDDSDLYHHTTMTGMMEHINAVRAGRIVCSVSTY